MTHQSQPSSSPFFSFHPDDLVDGTPDMLHLLEMQQPIPKDEKPAWLSLYSCPNYLCMNIERIRPNKSYSKNRTFRACITYCLFRLHADPRIKQWIDIRRAVISRQRYSDADDFGEASRLCQALPFSIDELHTGKANKFSVPLLKDERGLLRHLSDELGMEQSVLAQLCIIDYLRSQDDVFHKREMNDLVKTFHIKLSKKVRRVIAFARSLDEPLCPQLEVLNSVQA